jgi:hypothetical protein
MPRLSHDRSGRVPFSFAAVLILAGAIAAGAYMEQLGELRSENGRGSAGPNIEAQLAVIKNDLAAIARRDIGRAVDAQMGMAGALGPGAMGALDRSFAGLFSKDVKAMYGPRQLPDLNVNASVRGANLSAAPAYFRTMNRLGMTVDTAGAGVLRALCSVDLEFRPRAGPVQNRTVQVDERAPSWYPLAISQAVRMRRDCAPEGLVELFIREQLEDYLERSLPLMLLISHPAPIIPGPDVWGGHDFTAECTQAVRNALVMEELVLFGHCSGTRLGDFLESGAGTFGVGNALPTYSGSFTTEQLSDAPDGDELVLQMPPPGQPLTIYDDVNRSRPTPLFIFPDSAWREGPSVTVTKRLYAGEELRVDIFSLEVQVRGTYWLYLRQGEQQGGIRFEIPVEFDLNVFTPVNSPPFGLYESGRLHCQIEDMMLFESELSGLYRAPLDITLQMTNSSGNQIGQVRRPLSVEVDMDNELLGIFEKGDLLDAGLPLSGVLAGPHKFDVVLTYMDSGEVEYGSQAGVFNQSATDVSVRTDRGLDSSGFWSNVLLAIRNESYDMRMARMLEYFANITGFPMPAELSQKKDNSAAGVQKLIAWGQQFHRFLVNSGAGSMPNIASGDYREQMISTVEVMLETTARIESVLSGLEWDSQARSIALELMNISLKGFMDADKGSSIMEVEFKSSFAKSTLKFEKAADGKKRWTLERPAEKDFHWTFDRLSRKDRIQLAFEGSVDVAMIVCSVASIYTKYQRYMDSDGGLSQYETVDLSLDIAQVCLKVASLVTSKIAKGFFSNVGEAAGKTIKVAGEFVNFVAGFLQLYQMENDVKERFSGDEAAWGSLFSGLDETTLTYYLTFASTLVSFAAFGATVGAALTGLAAYACIASLLGPIGAILGLCILIVMIIFNSEAIACWFAGTATAETRNRSVNSVRATLQGSVGTIAYLNDYRSDEMMLEARCTRGAASFLFGIAMFMKGGNQTAELASLSNYSYDMAWAKEHQAVSVKGLRYFLVVMWKQANDFKDADSASTDEPGDLHQLPDKGSTGGDNDWHVDIKVTDPSRGWTTQKLPEKEITGYLLGLTMETATGVKVELPLFQSEGSVTSDGLNAWVDTIGRIGDMVKVWQTRLAVGQAMFAYVSGMSGSSYRHDLGYLQLRLEDPYISANVRIASHDGKNFRYFNGKQEVTVEKERIILVEGKGQARGFYLTPGRYDVEVVSHIPASESRWKKVTVDVFDYYSPRFCSRMLTVAPKPEPVFFTIDDRFNGTVELSVTCSNSDGRTIRGLFDKRTFNLTSIPAGRFYIDDSWIPGFDFDNSAGGQTQEMKDSLTYTVSISVRLDTDSDSKFEVTEYLNISTSSIRNDHVDVMQKQDSKHADQLEYRLVIYDTVKARTYQMSEMAVNVSRYTYWDTITEF